MMIDDESDKNVIKPELKPLTVPQISIPTTQLFAPSLFSSNPFPPTTTNRTIVPPVLLAPPAEQQKENPFESVNGKYYVSIEYLLQNKSDAISQCEKLLATQQKDTGIKPQAK